MSFLSVFFSFWITITQWNCFRNLRASNSFHANSSNRSRSPFFGSSHNRRSFAGTTRCLNETTSSPQHSSDQAPSTSRVGPLVQSLSPFRENVGSRHQNISAAPASHTTNAPYQNLLIRNVSFSESHSLAMFAAHLWIGVFEVWNVYLWFNLIANFDGFSVANANSFRRLLQKRVLHLVTPNAMSLFEKWSDNF